MSLFQIPDYKERYFEYKTLTKIHGRPTIDKLLTLYKQLKRNAQCVPTTLGGGQLGYLALVLNPTMYATIPGATAFVQPADPGPFILLQNNTHLLLVLSPILYLSPLPTVISLLNILIGKNAIVCSTKFKQLN